jgi:hypothetical protein
LLKSFAYRARSVEVLNGQKEKNSQLYVSHQTEHEFFFYSPSKRGRKDGGDDEPVNNILP